MFTLDQIRVAGNVVNIARKYRSAGLWHIPDLAVLAVTKQESDWNDTIEGDVNIGGSYGPFQIYQVAHPNTAFIAVNPWCDYGVFIMYQQWESTFQANGGTIAWNSDLIQRAVFLFNWAPQAQGSVPWTASEAHNNYEDALTMLELIS